MRARIAALTSDADPRSREFWMNRREQLNCWHADDRAADHTDQRFRSQQ